MSNTKVNWKQVFTFMGAVLAFAIGAGFATGQELLQYFSAYGWQSILVGITFIIIFIYSNYCFAIAGKRGNLTKGNQVFEYYCGPILGKIFDYFASIFCYMSFIVMVAGASSTLNEQYHIPTYIGGALLTVLAIITVIWGLNGIVNIISKIGPVLVAFALIIGIIALVTTVGKIPEGIELIQTGQVEVTKASTNWLLAGCSYGGFCLMWFAGFMAELGSKNNMKELMLGMSFSGIFNITACVLVGFALTASITQTSAVSIPNLVLAVNIWPPIATVYALIICAAIYSTACPLLWTGVVRFSDEGTSKFKILTVIAGILALIIALTVPYGKLLNYIYVLNGYGGFVLFAIMVVQDIRYRISHSNRSQV